MVQDGVPEAVPARMAYAAAHALKILDKALSREPPLGQKEYKYPHLHRLSFDPRLRREDLLNCKVCRGNGTDVSIHSHKYVPYMSEKC